jgi:hypothetical protein
VASRSEVLGDGTIGGKLWGQVLHYDNCAVSFALWLGPCDQSSLLRCIISPMAIAMLLSGREYDFSALRKLASFPEAISP